MEQTLAIPTRDDDLLERVAHTPEPTTLDAGPNASTVPEHAASRQRIEALLRGLDRFQSRVLQLLFGLDGGEPLSVAETATRLNVDPCCVRASCQEALRSLRVMDLARAAAAN